MRMSWRVWQEVTDVRRACLPFVLFLETTYNPDIATSGWRPWIQNVRESNISNTYKYYNICDWLAMARCSTCTSEHLGYWSSHQKVSRHGLLWVRSQRLMVELEPCFICVWTQTFHSQPTWIIVDFWKHSRIFVKIWIFRFVKNPSGYKLSTNKAKWMSLVPVGLNGTS